MQFSLPSFTFTVSSCFSTLEGSTSCEEHHMHIVPSPMVWHNRLGNDLDCIWRLKLVLLQPVYLIPFFTTQQLCRIIFHFWSVVYISMSDTESSYHVGFWPPPSLWNKRSTSQSFLFFFLPMVVLTYSTWHLEHDSTFCTSYPPSGAAQQELLSLAT